LLIPDFESSGKAITAKVKQKYATRERAKGLKAVAEKTTTKPKPKTVKGTAV
jgi:hypothetical protein